MEKKDKDVRLRAQFIHPSKKTKSKRRDIIYFQLSLSKEFERSNWIIMPGVWVDFNKRITS